MKGGVMPKALIAIVATAVVALSGCGGGNDSTGTATTQKTTTAAQEPKQAADDNSAAKSKDTGSQGNESSSSATSSFNQSAKAPAPGVPISRGGDNSIQIFGLEASSSERAQATATARAYLNARAAKQWSGACSFLAAPLKVQLQTLLAQAKTKTKGCSAAMEAMSTGVPASALRKAAAIHVLSLRVKGAQAFLIYRDGQGTPSALPMARQGEAWKVAALTGSALLL